MSRIRAALANDVRLQVRYGLYAVSVMMVVVWGALLGTAGRAVPLSTPMLLPPLVVLNLLITTFYFMASMVLFEKAEGVLAALIVTPMSGTTYLLSKAISLTLLATAETLLIAAVLFDDVPWTRTIVASLLLGFLYTCGGFLAVVRYNSINEFLPPSVLAVMVMLLPLVAHVGVLPRWTMLLHPVDAPMRMVGAATAGTVALTLVWCVVAFVAAQRAFDRFVVRA